KVGITKVEFSSENKLNLDQWISKGFHASMQWIENRKEERANIFNYFPDAVSLISVGMNYFSGNTQDDLKSKFKFSNYAWGEDYHSLIKDRLQILLKWIKNTSEEIEGVACVDTSPIMEKSWAQKAGLGWQGKHTNLISRDYGSWLFLGEIILNIPLDYDKPFIEDLCGSCTACIDACPTNAITSYQLDSNKCISYRTIEHRGEFDENENNLDGWIYGCDICQEVCPWNEKFSKISPEKSFFPKTEILDWSEKKWMDLDDATFKKLFKGSAVKRTKFSGLQRNIKQNSS
ncbi:MAG: tRNA epoxyqueuosine(34) reductase QueG, partial [Candidatus Neomarinimicrobiota bacterium]|nr:tRNA epoxyqueuosine(34) reductase QueG [Candidatus Neomarinimicrobiota bacterium]